MDPFFKGHGDSRWWFNFDAYPFECFPKVKLTAALFFFKPKSVTADPGSGREQTCDRDEQMLE